MQYMAFPLFGFWGWWTADVSGGLIFMGIYFAFVAVLFAAGLIVTREVEFHDALSAHNMTMLTMCVLGFLLMVLAALGLVQNSPQLEVNYEALKNISYGMFVLMYVVLGVFVRIYMTYSTGKSIVITVLYAVLAFTLQKVLSGFFLPQ